MRALHFSRWVASTFRVWFKLTRDLVCCQSCCSITSLHSVHYAARCKYVLHAHSRHVVSNFVNRMLIVSPKGQNVIHEPVVLGSLHPGCCLRWSVINFDLNLLGTDVPAAVTRVESIWIIILDIACGVYVAEKECYLFCEQDGMILKAINMRYRVHLRNSTQELQVLVTVVLKTSDALYMLWKRSIWAGPNF